MKGMISPHNDHEPPKTCGDQPKERVRVLVWDFISFTKIGYVSALWFGHTLAGATTKASLVLPCCESGKAVLGRTAGWPRTEPEPS